MKHTDSPVPDLIKLPAWGISVSNWRFVKDDKYFEAWRLGHRAPRAIDQSVIDVPGDLMEKLAKKGDKRELMLEGVMLKLGYVPNGEYWEEES